MSIEPSAHRLGRSGLTLLAMLLVAAPRDAPGQRPSPAPRDTTEAGGLTAGEADADRPRRQLINALQLDLGFTTMYVGGGVLQDFAMYDQDSASREQFHLASSGKLRDARFLFGGRFRVARPTTWQVGLMYDQITKKFIFRQTGVMVAVPEIWSHFFIGRAKEGFSLNKVMTGYDGWSMERLPFTDATVPLLADGIKWLGSSPGHHWFWNLGVFADWLSEGQSFSSYNYQGVVRMGWVPMVAAAPVDTAGTLLHLGMNFRAGDINNDTLQLRSRPEAFPAPYFLDTGKFPAQTGLTFGPEIYYRPGSLLLGGEFYWQKVYSVETGNPWFNGFEVVAAWLPTAETRAYNTVGHYFRQISPRATVIQGGPGAWEVVVKYSYTDLTDGPLDGGVFQRVTPMLNWHLTDNLRLEFAYGFGRLKRFGLSGETQFFQTRFQWKL